MLTGHQIGADLFLPSMATQEFLSCLSKLEIETVAAANGILPRPTGKATRAAVVDRFKTQRFVYPAATFALSQEELTKLAETQAGIAGTNDDESDVAIDDEAPDGPTEADEDPEDDPALGEAPQAGAASPSEQMAAE
ncbi:hypothetical protein [Acidiphilium acidophilum]|uniref:hypothetical protein n=1 Tax=Acidiphilium acidophilum TaxID=76588 RepID=UPI002E8E66FF|nr:hypothetical protein [Acidiphilium acidophilum]